MQFRSAPFATGPFSHFPHQFNNRFYHVALPSRGGTPGATGAGREVSPTNYRTFAHRLRRSVIPVVPLIVVWRSGVVKQIRRARLWSGSRTLRFAYSMKEQIGKYSIVEGHMLKSISGVRMERF
jgi:hypothetical protein